MKKLQEAIISVRKQLTIQRVIDKLNESHHVPSKEGKKLKRMGKKVLQQLNIGNYCENLLLEFLNHAKKLQSFEEQQSTLPILNENAGANNESELLNNEKKSDNINEQEQTNE